MREFKVGDRIRIYGNSLGNVATHLAVGIVDSVIGQGDLLVKLTVGNRARVAVHSKQCSRLKPKPKPKRRRVWAQLRGETIDLMGLSTVPPNPDEEGWIEFIEVRKRVKR